MNAPSSADAFPTRLQACALVIALVASPGCGSSTSEPSEPRTHRAAIEGGRPAPDADGIVALLDFHGDRLNICSGALVTPNLVLTARHCVAPGGRITDCQDDTFDQPRSPDEFRVATVPEIAAPENQEDVSDLLARHRPVEEVHIPGRSDEVCGTDIAAVILEDEVDSSEGTPVPPRVDTAPRADDAYRALGYGLSGSSNSTGVRRVRDGQRVICLADDCSSDLPVAEGEFMGSDGVCRGDSGGPALDANGRVIGLAARNRGNCESIVYTMLTPWSSWLRETAERAVELGSYAPPEWTGLDPDTTTDAGSDAPNTTGGGAATGPTDEVEPGPLAGDTGVSRSQRVDPPEQGCSTADVRGGGHPTVPAESALLLLALGLARARRRRRDP